MTQDKAEVSVMTTEEVMTYKREKLNVLALLLFSVLASFFIELFVVYGIAPINALTSFHLYRATFNGVVLLAILPFLVAYGLGRLLTLMGYILRDDKQYPTQYAIAWLVSLYFLYSFVMTALDKRQDVVSMTLQCVSQVRGKVNPSAKEKEILFSRCADKVISLYGKVRHCGMVHQNHRQSCINKVLTNGGFFNVSLSKS